MNAMAEHRWYAIQTTAGHENKVRSLIQRKIDGDARTPEARAIRQALAYIEEGLISANDFVDGNCTLEQLPHVFRAMAQGNRAVKTLVKTGQ